MRISDWSSDVCSSDLEAGDENHHHPELARVPRGIGAVGLVGEEGQHDQRDHGISCGRMHVRLVQRLEPAVQLFAQRQYHHRRARRHHRHGRSEEHTSELQSLMRISYAVFCLKKKKNKDTTLTTISTRDQTIKLSM